MPLVKREPETVMRLARMGSMHPSRLSFMRVLLRRLKRENWQVDRPVFDLDAKGVGVVTYRARGPERTYTLVCFAHDLPDELRSDRVIAEAWDATFTLFDGEPTSDDIERLRGNVPLQEAGRISDHELVLSRANKSVRLFSHVLERLSQGLQPDVSEIDAVGYLMRTTAVYGSAKFGAADRAKWAERPEFRGSFQPELLSVWLIRTFAADWVEHLARIAGGEKAARMDRNIRSRLGIGNSTGLGMAPFLINHPALIHSWINAREEAIARVRSLRVAESAAQERFSTMLERATVNALGWHSSNERQMQKVETLRKDLAAVRAKLDDGILAGDKPWQALVDWCANHLQLEAQEQINSLILEPYPELVDNLSQEMCADEMKTFRIDGTMQAGELLRLATRLYAWADDIDFTGKDACARVWYTSEEKLEPRLGERGQEALDPYEQPLAPARDARLMLADLGAFEDDKPIAEFLMKHPEHRHIVRRIQVVSLAPYGEIRDNTIDAQMLPIDLLRCKLSFFGATRFDPRSDRWVRITMYQNTPYPDELASTDPDDAFYPPVNTQ